LRPPQPRDNGPSSIPKDDATISFIAFSSDGSRFISKSQNTVKFWDGRTGSHINSCASASFTFSSDWSTLAFWSRSGNQLLDGITGTPINIPVDRIAFSPDSSRVAVAHQNGLQLWGRRMSARIATLEGRCTSIKFSPDGSILLASKCNSGPVQLWDGRTGVRIASFTGDPDGSIPAPKYNPWPIQLWDGRTGTRAASLAADPSTFSPLDSSILYSDGIIGTRIAGGLRDRPNTLAIFSPDSSMLASYLAGDSGTHIADLVAGYTPAIFSPDSSMLASCWGRTVQLWDGRTGSHTRALSVGDRCRSVQFPPDSSRLAVCGSAASLWDVRTGARIATLEGCGSSLKFSLDSSLVVSESCDTTKVWDGRTGESIGNFNAKIDETTFSADGSQLVMLPRDGTVRLLDFRGIRCSGEPS